MFKVAVIGASGYTGAELLGVIARHPKLALVLASSDSWAGDTISQHYPALARTTIAKTPFSKHADVSDYLSKGIVDLVFLAVPHGKSLDLVPALLKQSIAVIDLSGSYRLHDAAVYAAYYGHEHTSAELLSSAIYGLPEFNYTQLIEAGSKWRTSRNSAPLVAAPGCYPTAIALAALPLLKLSNFDYNFGIVANAISGISGAGKAACEDELGAAIKENAYAYNPLVHRHTPEIQQTLNIAARQSVNLSFVPHLVPMQRGMVATITARLNTAKQSPTDEITLHKFFADYYENSPFVSVLPVGEMPQSKAQTGSNNAQVGLATTYLANGKYQTVVSSCAIDNLGMGASYQAIQCANLLIGADETAGLKQIEPII